MDPKDIILMALKDWDYWVADRKESLSDEEIMQVNELRQDIKDGRISIVSNTEV